MAVKFRDYYEVLGVPRGAAADEIKRAYRRLARKHHPDLQPEAERARAGERFKEINEAYEVLNDPEKRARYDALGENWRSGMDFTPPPGWEGFAGGTGRGARRGPGRGSGRGPGHGPGHGPGRGSGSGSGAEGAEEMYGGAQDWGGFGDFSDFFEALFGQAAGQTRRGRRPGGGRTRMAFRGSDVEAELPIAMEDLLRGGKRRISLDGERTLDVEIPRGARDGLVLRLAGQGQPGEEGGPPGDLYLRLRIAPDSRFRVEGDDLVMDLPLWPWQAMLGAEVRVDTPEGPVRLKIPPETQSGRRLRLRGRGLPRRDGTRGDLHAVVRIVLPVRPGPQEREAYEQLRRSSREPADRPAQAGTP